ncbi:MAG: hypothetical protein KGO02_24190 [Alphaproteobacteria bacterium]|nr:hypothetical protein [Alphaproteobacteria bacterium]
MLGDATYAVLQRRLTRDPDVGDLIEGTGGLRKIRVQAKGHSGSGLVLRHGRRALRPDGMGRCKTWVARAGEGEEDAWVSLPARRGAVARKALRCARGDSLR